MIYIAFYAPLDRLLPRLAVENNPPRRLKLEISRYMSWLTRDKLLYAESNAQESKAKKVLFSSYFFKKV